MALLSRRRQRQRSSLARHPLEGVLSPREFGRVGALLLGSAGLMGASAIVLLVVSGRDVQEPGFHPMVIGPICVATVIACVLIVRRSAHFSPSWAATVMSAAIVLISVVGYFAGPRASPYATLFYIWVGTAFVLLPVSTAVFEVGLAGVLHAVLLAVQRGHPGPFAAWEFTFGVTALTAWVIKRFVDALLETAANERAARTEAQRGNEQLEQLNQRETEFLTRVSHEVRTPLNVIIGFADMLGDGLVGPLNAQQTEYVGEVQTSGRHLLDLIGDGLDVAKVEEGREDLELVDFDVGRVLVPAVGLFRPEAERRGVALDLEGALTPIVIRGDERKIRQAVLNLLSNAVKFTPPGGSVAVSVAARGGVVAVAVADTGPGIAEDDLERIFEEYRQVPGGAAAVGTGLGLPLARRFAEQHDGTLEVTSRPGGGSTFTVCLPVAGPTDPHAAPPPRDSDIGVLGLGGLRYPTENADLRGRMTRVMPVLGIGGVVLGAITVLSNIVAPVPGFRPVPLLVLAGLAVSIAAWIVGRRWAITSSDISVLLVAAAVGFTACDYYAGVKQQPYGALLYVWIGIAAVSFLTRPVVIAELGLVGAAYAGLLVVQKGNAAPVARWTVVMGVVVVSAVSVATLLARLRSLGDAERRARIRLEAIHAELEAASRHKTRFLATMSHELRTPLNAIIGFSEVLEDQLFGSLSAEQRDYVTGLTEAGHQLLALVNDILDLAKVDAGRMDLQLTEEVDITDVLLVTCTRRSGVPVEVIAADLCPIDVDEQKFRRILGNLVDELAEGANVQRVLVSAATSA
ncbi:MAG: histidine kinase dimerization/phospho-acceptor domain-containing protein, partial [Acidimicrobiales bacterium]